jgi:hypothetical protein
MVIIPGGILSDVVWVVVVDASRYTVRRNQRRVSLKS